MKFVLKASYQELKLSRVRRPFIGLVKKTWDDWGWKTLFQLYYFSENGQSELIGELKILDSSTKITKLEESFSELDSSLISLGQTLMFYEKLTKILGRGEAEEALALLNDIAIKPGLAEAASLQLGIANSLMRMSDAKDAFHWGKSALRGIKPNKNFKFEYTCQFKGAETPLITSLDFSKDNYLPWRLIGVIGRNGVGKTQFLGNLARDLAPPTREILNERSILKLDSPFSATPVFSRIIALSFSAFDQFSKPERNDYFSYIYCGARDTNGRLSTTWMRARFSEFVQRIEEMGNTHLWKSYLEEIAGRTSLTKASNTDSIEADTVDDDNDIDDDDKQDIDMSAETTQTWELESFSSGQAIIAYSIAAMIAYLQPRSLLLFDEPELHLHPSAVSQLIRILYELLEKFDSYAIITTHSPIIAQELPSKNIRVFEREGNITYSRELQRETFGENLSELSDLIFGNSENEQFFKVSLNKLAEDYDFDTVVSIFDGKLSLSALAYLSSLYDSDL